MSQSNTIKAELAAGKTVMFYTVGISMRPLLKERQTHVMIVPSDSFQKNDIVLYIRSNGNYVLHRLLRQDKDILYIRGDNTYTLESVKKSSAIGRVSHIYKNGKYIDVSTDKKYKVYVFFRNISYPMRFLYVKFKRAVKKLLKK